jgi:trans-AT polyketide synthase/acyltransferase/oxidoreductase domain-containing protein
MDGGMDGSGDGGTDGPARPVPVGVGGIGTPDEIATAVLLGADFLLTGAINACSPQARTSEAVRELLSTVTMTDTALAPSAELFRLGGRAHVLRKSTLFPARAARLHELQLAGASPASLPAATRQMIEADYFGQPLDEVLAGAPGPRAEPLMTGLLARYFDAGTRAALAGRTSQQLNWHVPCGPELGAFNLAAGGLGLADWRTRDVDEMARALLAAGARLLDRRLRDVLRRTAEHAESAAHS